MTDIYLYPSEPNPNDIKLRDPTVLDTPPTGGTTKTRMLLGVGT